MSRSIKEITDSPIKWYVSFVEKHYSSEVHALLALLPQFEHAIINPDRVFRPIQSLKALFGLALLDTKLKPFTTEPDTKVFFWPFQLHHSLFQALVYERLMELGINCQTLIFRKDLKAVLENQNISAHLIETSRKLKSFSDLFAGVFSAAQFVLGLLFEKVPWAWKKALIQSCIHLGVVKKAQAAAMAVAQKTNMSYHMVGYDFSILGRAIIDTIKQHGHKSGRIQNGAVNYRLAGFSEVDDLFLWDKESEEAYKSNGFKGNTYITGNILLQEKYPAEKAFPAMNPIIIDGYVHRVLVAFSGPGHNTTEKGHIESLRILLRLVKENPSVLFIHKLHSKDKDHYYDRLKLESNVRMAKDLFLDDLPNAINFIHATDLVITGASSVALDAINLNKLVVSIDPLNELAHFEFLKHPQVKRFKEGMGLERINNWIGEFDATVQETINEGGLERIVQIIKQSLEPV